MKLVVGLGNPTKQYDKTRHNMGFMVLDQYVKHLGLDLAFKEKFNALYLETIINNEKIIFVKPLTYMNNSGLAVASFANFYKIDATDILVISDDLDLSLSKFRLRPSGSSGGHNGLKSIITCLKTDKFKRLRVGISGNNTSDVIDYVLSKFSKDELLEIDKLYEILMNVLDDYFVLSFSDLMSKYNRKG